MDASNVMTPEISDFYYCNSSLHATLTKRRYDNTKERSKVEAWNTKQFQCHYLHTFKRRQICYNTKHRIPYRASRMWILLGYYITNAVYHMCRLWEYHQPKSKPNVVSRGNIMSASCRYCGNPIVFDDNILSKKGKPKPLNEWNHEPHNCKFSHFNKARESALEKKAIKKLEEWQVLEEFRSQVAATNNRLWNYELKLVVEYKED